MDAELMRTFWSLAEGAQDQRIIAVKTLVNILLEKQGKLETICKELTYTLNRLVKGLASSRKWARLGYVSAFTQVLRGEFPITVKDVLEIITKELKPIGSDTKLDQSNAYLGQLMGCLALIQSDIFLKGDEKDLTCLTERILLINKKKNPLHHLCTQALILLISKVSNELFTECVWPLIGEDLEQGWEKSTPDTVLILMTAARHQQEIVSKTFLQSHWKSKLLLGEKNSGHVASILMQSTCDHPIVHPICQEVLQHMARKPPTFTAFWNNVIYGKVFPSESKRKYLVFQLIPAALRLATTEEEIYAILDTKLVGCLMHSLSNKLSALHSPAKKLTDAIVESSAKLPGPLQVAVVTSLITSPGTALFDSVTKGRTVTKLLLSLSPEGLKLTSEKLMDNIRGEEITRPYNDPDTVRETTCDMGRQQKWSVNTLANFVAQPVISSDTQWCKSTLEFLLTFAFFDVDKTLKQPLNPTVKHDISLAMFRVFDKFAKSLGPDANKFSAYRDVLRHVVEHAQSLMDSDQMKLSKSMNTKVQESWQKVISTVNKIKKKKTAGDQNDEIAFELLFLHHGLQLLTDPKPAMEVLQEVHTCYDKASQKKRRRSTIVKPGEEPDWVDVILDLLLSLLSQESSLVRTVVNRTFSMLCPLMTQDSLELVLDVLKHDLSSEENPIDFVEDEEDSDEDSDGGASSAEEASSEQEENSASDTDSDNDSDDDEVMNLDNSLRESVKTALGRAADDPESEQEESSNSDLDDDEMFKLDEALAAVFKNRKRSKTEHFEREMKLKHYRMRCLDLLENFISQNNAAHLLLDLVYPLLHLMELGMREKMQKDLGDRATKLFHQLTARRKVSADPKLDRSVLPQMVQDLMEYSTKVPLVPLVREVATACLFVIHIVEGTEVKTFPSPLRTRSMAAAKAGQKQKDADQGRATLDSILEMIEEGWKSFSVQRESQWSPALFQTLVQKQPELFWPLSTTIYDSTFNPEVRIFCKTQACMMLSTMITKSSIQALEPNVWAEFAAKIIGSIEKTLMQGKKTVLKPRYRNELLGLLQHVMLVLDRDTTKKMISADLIETIQGMRTSFDDDGRQWMNKICGLYQSRMKPFNEGSKKEKQKKRKKDVRETVPVNGANTDEPLDTKQSKMELDPEDRLKAPHCENSSSPAAAQVKSSQATNTVSTSAKLSSHKKKKSKDTAPQKDSKNTSLSGKKKLKLKSPQQAVDIEASNWIAASELSDRTSQETGEGASPQNDKVKLNLFKRLLEEGKSSKKRRNSEVPPVSGNDKSDQAKLKKKKRKSMGDI